MVLAVHDLTDLLGHMSDGPYWFIKRKHQGVWYYMGAYNKDKNTVTWTKNQEYSTTYAEKHVANSNAQLISDHSGELKIVKEMLKDY